MLNRNQILKMLDKHRALCTCKQCGQSYECNIYDAAKSSTGDQCSTCNKQVSSLKTFTQNDLQRVFKYNPKTGELLYRNKSYSGDADQAAGYPHSEGYLSVAVGRKEYLVHRIIWTMQTGNWPDEVDHINHDRQDNCWTNLRSVFHQDQQKNMGLRKNNRSGVQGVRVLPSGRYHAYIMVDRVQIALGTYDDLDDATAARKAAEKQHGFHVNHGS